MLAEDRLNHVVVERDRSGQVITHHGVVLGPKPFPRLLTLSGDSAHDPDWLVSDSGQMTGNWEAILP